MDIAFLARLCGIIGLLHITYGVFVKDEMRQDMLFVAGGFGLLVYSINLKDPIFIPLQIIFILAGVYEMYTLKKKSHKK